MPLQLEGSFAEPDDKPEPVEDLHREIRRLESELRDSRLETVMAKNDAEKAQTAIRALRAQTGGLYRALRAVHGEIDLAIGEDDTQASRLNYSGSPEAPQFDPKWEMWKRKFPGKKAEVIDALLNHGSMNRSQLRAATNSGWSTIDAALAQLKGINLIEKSGDRWSLKV